MTPKIARFLAEQRPATPCLVLDLDVVEERYRSLAAALPSASIYYAVKANPAPEILALLERLGSCFDTASAQEIRMVLATGAGPERISFGNTIKKQADIAWAHSQGVSLYAFDSEAELEKLAEAAPGSRVFCRILVETQGAEWPLSRKFGCAPEMAADLLVRARERGLEPYGVSFHVGSQQTDTEQWDVALGAAKMVFASLQEAGIELKLVNLGGGFPTRYREEIGGIDAYGARIAEALARQFGNHVPATIVEPGRYMVGEAGVIEAEVVLVARKSYAEDKRWVYLDIGRFSGLAETEGEAIRYPILTPRDGGAAGPVVLAGPSCDSADILYDKAGYELPLDLAVGDRVRLLSTGAYTTTYASVGFNGFPPLASYCI
ncbi:MAG: type III PLP-dependent enzyme [Tistlia sp.]|uniref:type III PLP-dependent enzyme n=1 Tax=Tistlia sp. TaxID=3057121 RepID=UPI0034A16B7D